jgi:anti-sigma regulatory factor (Ser/Thr protein kinase)
MTELATANGSFRSTILPPTAHSVSVARHFTVDAMHELGADAQAERAELLVSELATNAVQHANTPMRVSVCRHGGRIRVEVRDDAPTRPQPRAPNLLALDGRGVALVDALAAEWGVSDNDAGKSVWFELNGDA